MRLQDLFHTVRFVVADRTRAALTLLGVVIGSGSIVLLASLLHGGEQALISASQQAVDADLVLVQRADPPLGQREKTRRELSRADARVLAESQATFGATVGSESSRATRAIFEGRKKRISLVSVTPSALSLYRLRVAQGRFFDDEDLTGQRRVCVVGHEVWTELLAGKSGLQSVRITIDDQIWSVVGVLEEKPILGSTTSTDIWDRKVLVPETTYDALLSPAHDADRLYVRRRRGPEIETPMDTLRGVIASTLLRRHLGVQNFKLEKEQSKGQERLILDVIKILLLGAGLVALFVGGINIMNVMLVTVTERTREIGVRRAVGATPRVILAQFLIESGSVALLGGLLGVATGAGLAFVAALVLGKVLGAWSFHLEAWSFALGLGLSLLTGVLFGLLPALRAARLNPIDALRSE